MKITRNFTKHELYLIWFLLKYLNLVCHSTEYLKWKQIYHIRFWEIWSGTILKMAYFSYKYFLEFANLASSFTKSKNKRLKIKDIFIVFFVRAFLLFFYKIVFSSGADSGAELFVPIAVNYLGQKLHLLCLSSWWLPLWRVDYHFRELLFRGALSTSCFKSFSKMLENQDVIFARKQITPCNTCVLVTSVNVI